MQLTEAAYPIQLLDDDGASERTAAGLVVEPFSKIYRPRPRFVVDLSPHKWPIPRSLQTSSAWRSQVVVETVENCLLTWADLFFVNGLFRPTETRFPQQTLRAIAEHPENELIYKSSGVRAAAEGYEIAPEAFSSLRKVGGRVMFGTPDEPANWGLFLLNTLRAAEYFIRHRDQFHSFFCFAGTSTMREMLKLAGIADSELIEHVPMVSHEFDRVTFFRQQYRDLMVGARQLDLYRQMAESVPPMPEAPKRIFVSRSRLPTDHYRQMTNEAELAAFLETRGFSVVAPETLSAAEQIALFHSAEEVVGLGGAGMFNTVFCRPGTRVLDIESTPTFLEAHANLFGSLGLTYAMLIGNTSNPGPGGTHSEWSLGMAAAGPIIDRFFSTRFPLARTFRTMLSKVLRGPASP